MTTIPCASAIGDHLLNNLQCAEQCHIGWFETLSGGRSFTHLRAMEATLRINKSHSLWTEIICLIFMSILTMLA